MVEDALPPALSVDECLLTIKLPRVGPPIWSWPGEFFGPSYVQLPCESVGVPRYAVGAVLSSLLLKTTSAGKPILSLLGLCVFLRSRVFGFRHP